MQEKKLKHRITVFISKSIIRAFASLSLKNSHRIGALFGWLLSISRNRHHFITAINVRLCFPEMDKQQQKQLVRQSLIESGKAVAEISPIWNWKRDKILGTIQQVHGKALLDKALQRGKGVIMAAPHIGCWEILGLYLSDQYPTTYMYQKPKLSELDEVIKSGRQRFGGKLVPTDNQGIRAMLKSLKNNELVCILPDQEPAEGNGIFAPFFGIQCYSMTLISRFAQKTGATVLTIYAKRLPNGEGYEVFIDELDNIREGTLEDSVRYLNDEIEKIARTLPEQYQWSYKRFRKQPPESGNIHDPYFH